jgi:hypothetical protein
MSTCKIIKSSINTPSPNCMTPTAVLIWVFQGTIAIRKPWVYQMSCGCSTKFSSVQSYRNFRYEVSQSQKLVLICTPFSNYGFNKSRLIHSHSPHFLCSLSLYLNHQFLAIKFVFHQPLRSPVQLENWWMSAKNRPKTQGVFLIS